MICKLIGSALVAASDLAIRLLARWSKDDGLAGAAMRSASRGAVRARPFIRERATLNYSTMTKGEIARAFGLEDE